MAAMQDKLASTVHTLLLFFLLSASSWRWAVSRASLRVCIVLIQEDTIWQAVMVAAYRKWRTTELQKNLHLETSKCSSTSFTWSAELSALSADTTYSTLVDASLYQTLWNQLLNGETQGTTA